MHNTGFWSTLTNLTYPRVNFAQFPPLTRETQEMPKSTAFSPHPESCLSHKNTTGKSIWDWYKHVWFPVLLLISCITLVKLHNLPSFILAGAKHTFQFLWWSIINTLPSFFLLHLNFIGSVPHRGQVKLIEIRRMIRYCYIPKTGKTKWRNTKYCRVPGLSISEG